MPQICLLGDENYISKRTMTVMSTTTSIHCARKSIVALSVNPHALCHHYALLFAVCLPAMMVVGVYYTLTNLARYVQLDFLFWYILPLVV